jgi:hypothetical protein
MLVIFIFFGGMFSWHDAQNTIQTWVLVHPKFYIPIMQKNCILSSANANKVAQALILAPARRFMFYDFINLFSI